MTSKQLTALAIKILAIWLLISVVLYLPSIAMIMTHLANVADKPIPSSLSVAVFFGFLVVGLVVSFIMLRVSKSFLAGIPESNDKNILTPIFVLQITGLFFIVSSLTELPGYGLSLSNEAVVPLSSYGYLAGYIFKIGVGAYLLVKPSVWGTWFNKLRGRE